MVPDLDRAVPVGQTRIWSDVIRVKDATFLKPHFVGVNLRAGDIVMTMGAGDVWKLGERLLEQLA